MVFTSWEFQPSYLQRSLKVFFELVGAQAASCALISILLSLLVRPDWVKCSLFLCMLKWMMVLMSPWLWAAECHQRLFETICLRCPLCLANGLGKMHLLKAEHGQATVACLLWSHRKKKNPKLGHTYPRDISKSKHWKASCNLFSIIIVHTP